MTDHEDAMFIRSLVVIMRWLALMVLACVTAGSYGCYVVNYAPLKAGLCQGSAPGIAGPVWVKCEKPAEGGGR